MNAFTESVVEQAALDWFRALGYNVVGGPDMPPGPHALRESYADTIFPSVIRGALARLNPELPAEALDDAFRRLTRPEGSVLAARNLAFHRMAVDGVTVEYRDDRGTIRGAPVQVLDFEQPTNNDWLAVNQFTVVEGNNKRRPDIVLFVNGLPLAVIELKNPGDEDATIRSAWQQLRTYQAELPSLFTFNAVLAVSDGVGARLGTLTAGWEWFKPWPTISGEELAPVFLTELQAQPVRLHRRLRAAHARRAAPRIVHRLHRHADRASGRQHPCGVRRLHQHLRHPARGRGPGDGPDLLREPARQARARRARASPDRPRLRGGDRRRGGRPQGEAQDEVGAA